ncbi:hypothetical protein QTP70_026404 [Hemibagrus guttatus]|uniref:Uncharacterized protein n=1 Tax=Hemibagrus guttatus TaxID=175788 RepID=A0AAE0R8Q1_9TELE|nr:hypothetical protein QTP70_026404 [Hemibagrus guttatus]
MSEFVSGFITQTKMDFTIRAASLEDCKDIRRMMSTSFFHAIIAEVPEEHKAKDGHTKIGFSMYFYSYSSWKGRAVGGLVCDARVQRKGHWQGTDEQSCTVGTGCWLHSAQFYGAELEQDSAGLLSESGFHGRDL